MLRFHSKIRFPNSKFRFPNSGTRQLILKSPKDGGDLTISGNLKSFEVPVLNCSGTTHRECYLNELVIHEMWKNTSVIFKKNLFRCCTML